MKNLTYVIIGGYFFSGSSAVKDLLKEYSGVYDCGSEIRFINDPYGLISLEENLTVNWDWIRGAVAIDDFLEFCKKCSGDKTRFPFSPFGMGYKSKINRNFMGITNRFIESLVEFRYDGDFYAYQAKEPYFSYVINRCRLGLEIYSKKRIPIHKKRMVGYAHPTEREFSDKVKQYFDELFEEQVHSKKTGYIILDQAIHPRDSRVIKKYFRKAKMIIVDRDPRDMFIQSVISGSMAYDNSESAGNNYMDLQNALHENEVDGDEDILYLSFENLIEDYSSKVREIEQFLGLKAEKHIWKKKYFNPMISMKNIGIWKKYYKDYNKAIDAISKRMGER